MKQMAFEAPARLPEEPAVEFHTTGYCGDGARHGGSTTLTISMKGGGDRFRIRALNTAGKVSYLNDLQEISISVLGDQELDGMVRGLILLGHALGSAKAGQFMEEAQQQEG